MNSNTINTQNQANNAGVPPEPPKAPQKAGGKTDIKALRRSSTSASFELVQEDDDLGVSVFRESLGNGKVVVKAFSGKRKKPDFHYIFRDLERANRYVAEWYIGIQASEKRKASCRAARKSAMAKPQTTLCVGDVLMASWGYDQTNVDYYQVTKLIGKRTVEIRAISKETKDVAWMQGECVPRKNHFIGEPMRRRVNESGSVKVMSWGVWAHKEENLNVGGMEIFTPRHWTSYA
jgi:hypothetical protein